MNKNTAKMKTVIITGANRGIGFGLCKYYLHAGWQVFASHRASSAVDTLHTLLQQFPTQLVLIELDVSDETSINTFGTQIKRHISHVDVLINNAGVSINADFGDWDQALFVDNFKANVVGPALLIQSLFRLFDKNSKVIQISSGLASIQELIGADAPYDAYSLCKVSLNMLSKRLATRESTKQAIYCSISPGWVQTDMGGKDATSTVEEAASQIGNTINALTHQDSGSFKDSLGQIIPW